MNKPTSPPISHSSLTTQDQLPLQNTVIWHKGQVSNTDKVQLLQQKPITIWLTGLSGAGKSTLAFALEKELIDHRHLAFVLDGDNIRHGLNRDLSFSPKDRHENIRRIAEVARLMNQAGLIVISAFISPYTEDRASARNIIGINQFIEIHLSTNISICEQRDPKGLYKRARAGTLNEFTGISAPYEIPENPELRIDTNEHTIEQSVSIIVNNLISKQIIPKQK